MRKTNFTLASLLAASLAVALTGCVTAPPAPPRPLLYPNATFNKIGQAAANAHVDACLARAQATGLTPTVETHAAMQGAASGGVMGGVAGVVGGLVTGHGLENSLAQGVASATVGGAVGAAEGSMRPNQPNPLYRNFVQRCLGEQGLESIGWN